MVRLDPGLADQVAEGLSLDAAACMNCGFCTALCPMGTPHLPREVFRYVLLGMTEEVIRHQETVFSCLLCKLCEVNCPAGVHITDNVRALRHHFNRHVWRL